MASWPKALFSAAGQLGERHSSKLMSPHFLNCHGWYQVRQCPVAERPVDTFEHGVSACGELMKDILLFGHKAAK